MMQSVSVWLICSSMDAKLLTCGNVGPCVQYMVRNFTETQNVVQNTTQSTQTLHFVQRPQLK